LATDGSIWVAVWYSRDTLASLVPASDQIGNDTDILFARSMNDGATWTDPEPLNNNATTDGNTADNSPTLTTDGTTWLAAWLSGNTLGDTIGSDVDILMARSTDGGVTWTDPEPLNADAATDSSDDDYQAVTTDGQGNWVATWHATDWP
jgi:Neuraminidase (sialidase)